jgi:hydroxymethylpyrimidine/phosphomethylpyrimidine kinase
LGVPYTLVTGIPLPDQFIDNVLASPQAVLCSARSSSVLRPFSRVPATRLSAALAALLASGSDLAAAVKEALSYLDRCLDSGFRPAWATWCPTACSGPSPKTDDADERRPDDGPDSQHHDFEMPTHDTKH